ncbi:MAG: HAD-IB family hydrolase, partial [Burkholderiales bacterium]
MSAASEKTVERVEAKEKPARKPARPRVAPKPGTLAEIEQGPSGKSIAAIFDYDGTLIAGYSAIDVAQMRIMRRQVSARELMGLANLALQGAMGRADFKDLIAFMAENWKGRQERELMLEGERLFKSRIVDRLFPEMKRRIDAHRAKGHTIILASSATPFQVEPAARYLGIDNVLCTRFGVIDGRLTGKPEGRSMWGEGKAAAVTAFAKKHRIDLHRSYAYADGNEEVPLMKSVGNPRPTNPQPSLLRAAKAYNWPVLKFESRGRPKPETIMRTMASLSAIGPIAALGTAAGILSQDVRTAVNVMTPAFADVIHAFAGVELDVTGEEHLWSHRPAVFIFNHRNNFDAFIVSKLVRTDFTGVAKKELERHPLMGPIGRLMKVAFIDRSDTKKAVDAMKSVIELARDGMSIIIAPEGTRAKTRELLPFKKGAFRMAMAT